MDLKYQDNKLLPKSNRECVSIKKASHLHLHFNQLGQTKPSIWECQMEGGSIPMINKDRLVYNLKQLGEDANNLWLNGMEHM